MNKQLNLFEVEEVYDVNNNVFTDENKYSQKVKTPIYTPSEKDVSIYECYNNEKYRHLCHLIELSDVSKEEKIFCKLAASRFIEFNYEKIADYYANSSKEAQYLFEKLALVVIDFDKAIENGFIQINEKLRELYEQENKKS
jgi:hypothetical protein